MIRLDKSLHAWGKQDFDSVLKQEIEQLGVNHLPLQQGLSTGNYVTDDPITVIINSVTERENTIRVELGIFYTGLIGGCSCADDPSPSGETNEFCELRMDIDRATATTTVTLAE